MRRMGKLVAALVGGLMWAAPAQAQYPDRITKLVVPFPPGGGVDLIARIVGQGIAEELGQPVIIENKAGGGTLMGTDYVAKSAPDGYTLVLASFAHAVNPSLQPRMPYDTAKAFHLGRGLAGNVSIERLTLRLMLLIHRRCVVGEPVHQFAIKHVPVARLIRFCSKLKISAMAR